MRETGAPYGYDPNDPFVVCGRSGWKVRLSDTRTEWNGLRVAKQFYEPKHPSLDIPAPYGEEVIDDPTGKPQDVHLEEPITDWSSLG